MTQLGSSGNRFELFGSAPANQSSSHLASSQILSDRPSLLHKVLTRVFAAAFLLLGFGVAFLDFGFGVAFPLRIKAEHLVQAFLVLWVVLSAIGQRSS